MATIMNQSSFDPRRLACTQLSMPIVHGHFVRIKLVIIRSRAMLPKGGRMRLNELSAATGSLVSEDPDDWDDDDWDDDDDEEDGYDDDDFDDEDDD